MKRKTKIIIFMAILLLSLAIFGGVKYLNIGEDGSFFYTSKVLVQTEPRDIPGFSSEDTVITINEDGKRMGKIYQNRSVKNNCRDVITANIDIENLTQTTTKECDFVKHEIRYIGYGLITMKDGIVQATNIDGATKYEK